MGKTEIIVDVSTGEVTEIGIEDIEITIEEARQLRKSEILQELVELDEVMPRCIEDMVIAHNDIETANYPPIFKERFYRKQALRNELMTLQ